MAKKKPADAVTFVKERSEEGTNWNVMRRIQINRSFYAGDQWISWDKTQNRVYVPKLNPGEKRYTYNKIKPHVLTLLAKLCKNRIELDVAPDTDDDERIETARASHKYLRWQWNDDDMDYKSRRLRFHMLLDGCPALKVIVDKSKGDDIEIDESALDEEQAELLKGGKLPTKTGKIVTQVVDQYALKVDPAAEDVSEIRWFLEERPMDVDEVQDIWNKEVQADNNIRQTYNPIGDRGTNRYNNHALVYDYWELPSGKYPNGRRIVIAGDQVLENNEDPGENPFILFPAIPVPGTAIGDGVVSDMTTPQKSYNIKRTAEARILEEMGNPMWTIPLGTMEDEDEITNEIGGIIHYTPNGQKPERVPGASVDAGWQNAMERDEADLEDMSGAHEISQGASPKGNNTLGGLQLQVEQDETRLAILVQSYEDGIKKWGEKVLKLVQRHFPEEQQLNIVGKNGEIEAFTFSGADLTGGEVVDVVPGSSMPTLKVAEDQKVMAMWGAGMFVDPATGMPDTRRVVRMLGESIANSYFDETQQDENKARMENRTWQKAFEDPQTAQALAQYAIELQGHQMFMQMAQAQGIMVDGPDAQPPQPPVKLPIVRDFYDHKTHIQVHNRFRKSDEYEKLTPEQQMLVDMHVQEHLDALNAPMIAQQQAEMAAQQQQQQADQENANAERQHQQAMKKQDQDAALQRDMLKSRTTMAQAAMKNNQA